MRRWVREILYPQIEGGDDAQIEVVINDEAAGTKETKIMTLGELKAMISERQKSALAGSK